MIGSELMQAAPAQLRDFAARYTAAWCSQDPTSVAGFCFGWSVVFAVASAMRQVTAFSSNAIKDHR
jgi:surfactin synthase thioesterase subunit